MWKVLWLQGEIYGDWKHHVAVPHQGMKISPCFVSSLDPYFLFAIPLYFCQFICLNNICFGMVMTKKLYNGKRCVSCQHLVQFLMHLFASQPHPGAIFITRAVSTS